MTTLAPILIAGPTASGKSGLALAIAERIDGTVINADAMQVYRELRVLTARPSAEDERRAPHKLYGHVPGSEAYSAARFAIESAVAIAGAQASGRTPIVVGGTGLYFKALTEGLSPIPQIPDEIRAAWRTRAEHEGPAALHAILAERDPEMAARLRPTDPQRLARALEVLDATGVSLARWQEQPGTPVARLVEGRAFVIFPDRATSRTRIDARFDTMLEQGALGEVATLMQLELGWEWPVMRALGVAPLAAAVAGRATLADATAAAKAETWQYAKRQVTWLKKHMITWKAIESQEMERTGDEIIALIQSSR